MRIFFASVIILLSANLAIDLMDSNMVQLIEERNSSIQKFLTDSLLLTQQHHGNFHRIQRTNGRKRIDSKEHRQVYKYAV